MSNRRIQRETRQQRIQRETQEERGDLENKFNPNCVQNFDAKRGTGRWKKPKCKNVLSVIATYEDNDRARFNKIYLAHQCDNDREINNIRHVDNGQKGIDNAHIFASKWQNNIQNYNMNCYADGKNCVSRSDLCNKGETKTLRALANYNHGALIIR